jgi:hypothetical protein
MNHTAHATAPLAARGECPAWCTTTHGVHLGEEDWTHQGGILELADDATARLCMSIDPDTGERDGPYVLIGSCEYSLPDAADLAARLTALVSAALGHSASSRNALSRS